jgi:FAD/FMN-containing dehydrogenase
MTIQQQFADSQSLPPAIRPDDPRYASLVGRGNRRFTGTPDEVCLVTSTGDVVRAVQNAVTVGRQLAVRSGGHCFEGFVDDPAVRSLIDMSLMNRVEYDAELGAFMVEAGATLGEVYRKLYMGWRVTIPAGLFPDVGVGGHILGGGYGYLCRLHGLAVDHLHAVEVVVVNDAGQAESIVATRHPDDPHHDLWWAHTGGGGGNFGVVTRYWFRTPGSTESTPAHLLPKPPEQVLSFSIEWDWETLDEQAFVTLIRNHGQWFESDARPDSAYAGMYSEFYLWRRSMGTITLEGQLPAGPGAEQLLDVHLEALSRNTVPPAVRKVEVKTWLAYALEGSGMDTRQHNLKTKDSYQRRRLTDEQISVAYRYLTTEDVPGPGGALILHSFGGRVNAVAPEATAVAQRDSVLKLFFVAGWGDTDDETPHLAWVRGFFRDVYADTGGVPVTGTASDGSYINMPDIDLDDPDWNTSGEPWHTLYYKGNYARLQRIKAAYDPRDIFRHRLSIRPS